MLALLLALSLQAPCSPEAASLVEQAGVRASEFDLVGAADLLRRAVAAGCGNADVAALYVGGLVDARAAFSQGGSSEALAPVTRAIDALAVLAADRPGPAEIARLTLHAAAAAAQSERDEMRVYLDSAIQMETLQRAAGQTGAPIVSPVEIAGDLWLQIYRYDDARRAYGEAADQRGFTPRISLGLARSHAHAGDVAAACASYRVLLDGWGTRPDVAEILEGRAYVREHACARPQ